MRTSHQQEMRNIAKAFFDAIEAADIEQVGQLYADDIVVWHAAAQIFSTKSENLAALRHSTSSWPGRRYEQRDVSVFDDGFAQQHMLVRDAGGERRALPACIICKVQGGRITRLYEYFDASQLAAWRA